MDQPPDDMRPAADPAPPSLPAPPPPWPGDSEPAPAPAFDPSPRPFRFTGTAGEYFRIWIVNLLLSVVTLGIYSAWAKVRRLRYFYGHTSVDGGAFGYHASPIAILKGRLIAYAVVLVLATLGQIAPLAASVLYLPLVMVMPIVLVRAFRFRAANSSYRGIRFGYDGVEADAYRVFLFLPVLVPFTLGLVYPFIAKAQREFFVNGSRYGRSPFALALPTGRVYRIYLLAAAGGLLWLALAVSVLVAGGASERIDPASPEMGPRAVLALAMVYAGIGAVIVGVRTAFENLVWNHTTIDGHRFASRLTARGMFWRYATNVLAIVATLGLAVPWARIRMARYRAESLTLLPSGPLVSVAEIGGAEDAATGAELSDAMDLDFGL